jgi:hypothetical protein
MGREIAQVMGPDGIGWLDRPEREQEERPGLVIDALELRAGEVVVDLGGWLRLLYIPHCAEG